jgi:ATP sulfurylase
MDELGDLGIQLLFFDAMGYDASISHHGPVTQGTNTMPIDGTQIRNALRDGESVPDWMMRDIIQDALQAEVAHNRPLFVK